MNWYKKTIKIAVPVMEESKYKTYLDIGHHNEKGVILWVIDRNFNFYKIKENKNIQTHDSWLNSKKSPLKNSEDDMVVGRYDPNAHTTSAQNPRYAKKLPETTKRYFENKVNEILNYQFGNPQIQWFWEYEI